MRRREYDVVRALAVVFMIAVHVMLTVYDGSSAVVCKLVDFLGSAPAAPVFMFLLGCNVLTSRHNGPRALFVRGLKLFLLSYLFNAVCHALPAFIAGYAHPTHGGTCAGIGWLLAVDILTFAGLAFMALGVVRKLKLSPAAFFGIAVALHAVGTVLNAAWPIPFETNVLRAGFLSIFYNASAPGYFPFLTWLVYPAAGLFFADLLRRAADEERVWRGAGLGAGLVFAVMLTCFCLLPSVHERYYADEYVYYRNGYFLLVHNLAFVVAWLSLWHVVCRRFMRLGTGLFLVWSRNLLKIYVMQWFFIGAFFIAPFGEALRIGTGAFLASVAGILCLCTLIVFLHGGGGKRVAGGRENMIEQPSREDDMDLPLREPIKNNRELEFAVFCIENVAEVLDMPSDRVYRALTGRGDILNQYIVPSYDVLHTQGRDYIVNDIREVMEERGVVV